VRDGVARTGIGFDVHRFAAGRALLLGGVTFADHDGLAGHSDGDVVCHAVADSLLGAAALGDVGTHFPDADPSIEGIAGTDLLTRTVELLSRAGFSPTSCDVTVIAESPAIAPRREEIRAALAAVLGVGVGHVSVKATRPEGLGLTGEGVGCLAVAVVV
jgi:2-C-methyl-D-erythritol 2,4-cyclodiphosphate synthase